LVRLLTKVAKDGVQKLGGYGDFVHTQAPCCAAI
jgi:hypothetical protein